MLLAIPFGLLIGLIVGAVGGGGAILALPVLVYVLDEPVSPASTASLIVVAIAAAVGAGSMARNGQVCWRIALTFSVPAAIGALAGTIASNGVSGAVLVLAFVPVMLVAAGATWQRAESGHADAERSCPEIRASHVLGVGVLVGALTGFFGVGGGFVIVPVLTLMFGVTFRHAVATSLIVISVTGMAALVSHLATGASLDIPVTAVLAGATAIGALTGTLIGEKLPQRVLGKGFAFVVTAVALFLLVDTIFLGGPPGS